MFALAKKLDWSGLNSIFTRLDVASFRFVSNQSERRDFANANLSLIDLLAPHQSVCYPS